MDQRQAQIRERAGLEESRINEDFVDFLKKYGLWILLTVVLIGGYSTAKRWFVAYSDGKVDKAFTDLEDARAGGDNVSPDSLLAVADEHASVRAVGTIARLDAADSYLSALRRGVKIGAAVGADGTLERADDVLTPEDRVSYAAKATEQFQRVADESATDTSKRLWHINGLFGLAAVAETERNFEKAKLMYGQVEQAASEPGFQSLAAVAKARAAALETLKLTPPLLAKADLPELAPPPAAPVIPGAAGDSPFSLPMGASIDPGLTLTPAVVGEPLAPPVAPADGSNPLPTNPQPLPELTPGVAPAPVPATPTPTTIPPATPASTPVPTPAPVTPPVPETVPTSPK
mgnify:CR=1 FL=1